MKVLSLLAFCVLWLPACDAEVALHFGSDGLAAVLVVPSEIEIVEEEVGEMRASGVLSTGDTVPISATWSSSDTTVARVRPDRGRVVEVVPAGVGEARITARRERLAGTASVSVSEKE